jgi:T5SS/PEP-CTERM-associated repeat protein
MKKKHALQRAGKFTRNALLLALTTLALLASPGSRGDAALCGCLRYWCNSGAGDWFDPSNWCPYQDYVPGCGEQPVCPIDQGITEADINNGGTAQISGLAQTARACETFLGYHSGQSGNLSVDHGTLDMCNEMHVGYEGTGTLKITNGGLVTTIVGALIASQAGSNGAGTVDGTNPDGRKSTWTVTGGGLYIGGDNTTAGGTGLLTVTNEGMVNADNVHVWKSGTLTGNGTVTLTNGTTTMDGTLAPSWTLTISGNVGFGTLGTMQCNVTPANLGNTDVEVSGTATLNGRLSVTMIGTFTPGTRFTLLHANVRNGVFSSQSIQFPTGQGFTPEIIYDTNHVYLNLASNTGP